MDITSKIWEDHADHLRNFIYSKVKDEQMTDDILQDVFLKIHIKNDQLKDFSKTKEWAFMIARNTIYDFYKTNTIYKEIKNEFVDSTLDDISGHTEKDCLYGIIKSLPPIYREPLFLSDIKGMKQAEIALKFELPLPTVKSRIQRARKMITEGYMNCCDYKLNAQGKLVGEIKDKKDCKICNH